jgi:hypothetical protein
MICEGVSYNLIKEHVGSIPFKNGMILSEVEELLGAFEKKLVYHAYMKGIHTIIYSKKSVMLYMVSGNGLHDFKSKKERRIIMRKNQ